MADTCPTCRAVRAVLGVDAPQPALIEAGPRYFIRATAPEGAQGRTWDKLVKDYTPLGKCFKPGREIMIQCDDVHAWIESHSVAHAEPVEAKDDAPISIAAFRRRAR